MVCLKQNEAAAAELPTNLIPVLEIFIITFLSIPVDLRS